MKTIAQLLELKDNQYYVFTPEEQQKLDDFLASPSAQQKSQKTNGKDSEKNIPATVVNKNVVKKTTGVLPTSDQIATGTQLAQAPATANNPQ